MSLDAGRSRDTVGRALVVDPAAEERARLRSLLEDAGYEVGEAGNGAEALLRAHERLPDVVIAGLRMPVIDGFTLLQLWKGSDATARVPFVMHAAADDDPDEGRRSIALGADAFLAGPPDPATFAARIAGVVATPVAAVDRVGSGPPPAVARNEAAEQARNDAFERIREGILALDTEWRYTYANAHAAGILGKQPEDIVGKHFLTVSPEAGEPCPEWEQALREQRPVRTVGYFEPWRRWFETTVYPSGNGISIHFHDITDQKETEAQLRAASDRLDFLVAATPAVIYTATASGDFPATFITSNVEEQTGWPAADFLGDPEFWSRNVHPEDVSRVLGEFAAISEEGLRTEYRFRFRDGTYHWMRDSARAVRAADGTFAEIAGYWIDVTDRKEAEEALRESEERFRLALDAAHVGTYDWDVALDRVTWSRWHEELWGYAPGEFDGTYAAFAARVHPDDLPLLHAKVGRCMAERARFEHEFRVLLPDGSVRWINGRGEFTFDGKGRPLRMHGLVVETTDRKRAEMAVEESERRLRLILDGLGPSMFVGLLDREGRVLVANRPVLEAAGVTAAEVEGKPIWETVVYQSSEGARDRARRAVGQAADGTTVRYDEQIEVPGQKRGWIDFSLHPLRDHDGNVAFIIPSALAINERKVAEQKLEESGRQLRALLARFHHAREEERIRVSREIHDGLGQLLTSLKMDLRWLERRMSEPAFPAEFNPLIDRLVGASELVDTTIAAVQRIAVDLRSGVLDRLGLPAALAEEGRRFEERTGIRCGIVSEIDGALPSDVASELLAICQESLANVARHSRATRAMIALRRENGVVVLEISDDGIGVTDEAIAARESLGLLGIRERAGLCGGTVRFQRCEPHGTRVTTRVPNPSGAA